MPYGMGRPGRRFPGQIDQKRGLLKPLLFLVEPLLLSRVLTQKNGHTGRQRGDDGLFQRKLHRVGHGHYLPAVAAAVTVVPTSPGCARASSNTWARRPSTICACWVWDMAR